MCVCVHMRSCICVFFNDGAPVELEDNFPEAVLSSVVWISRIELAGQTW